MAEMSLGPAPRGIELGYAERTTDFVGTASAAIDVPGLLIAFPEPDVPYYVEAETHNLVNNTAGRGSYLVITDDLNNILATSSVWIVTAATGEPAHCKVRIPAPASAGSTKTYKARILAQGTSVPTFGAAATAKGYLTAWRA